MKKYTCPCCGYKTFDEAPGSYEICPICFWEDDKAQLLYPGNGGANVNLIKAQKNYDKFGACEERLAESVRKVNETDVKDPQWRKFDIEKDEMKESSADKNYFDMVVKADDVTVEYYWLKKL